MKLSTPNRKSVVALAVLLASPSHAIQDGGEGSFLEPLPVVLSVSRLPAVRHDVAGSVTVIDEDLIKATGYRELSRLLRLVPGMQIGQERGNSYWITYHGLGKDYPNQVQLLVDGSAVAPTGFNRLLNSMPQPVPFADIERIEVLRGSDYSTYGSSGFLGLINIVTRDPRQTPGTSVQLAAGGNGVRDVVASTSVAPKGGGGLRLTAQSLSDEGFRDLHDGRRVSSLHLRYDQPIDISSRLSLNAWYQHSHRQLGYPDTRFNSNGIRRERTDSGIFRIGWHQSDASTHGWNFVLLHGAQNQRDRWLASGDGAPVPLPPSIPVNADNRRTWSSFELQRHGAREDGTRWVWGGEIGRDSIASQAFFHERDKQTRSAVRLFGTLELPLSETLTLNSSLMVERFDDQPVNLAPRLFLIRQTNAKHAWRLGYTRAYHQPSVFEQRTDARILDPDGRVLHRRQVPNPDVRAQRIDVIELGLLGELDGGGSHDIRVFRERISRLIQRTPVEVSTDNPHPFYDLVQAQLGASQWSNSASPLNLSGIEYELRTPSYGGARFLVATSLIRVSHRERQTEKSVARWTASLTWLQHWGVWESSASILTRSSVAASVGFVPEYACVVPRFTQLDFSLSRPLRLGSETGELRISGINLLSRHQEVANNPLQAAARGGKPNLADRSVFASISFAF